MLVGLESNNFIYYTLETNESLHNENAQLNLSLKGLKEKLCQSQNIDCVKKQIESFMSERESIIEYQTKCYDFVSEMEREIQTLKNTNRTLEDQNLTQVCCRLELESKIKDLEKRLEVTERCDCQDLVKDLQAEVMDLKEENFKLKVLYDYGKQLQEYHFQVVDETNISYQEMSRRVNELIEQHLLDLNDKTVLCSELGVITAQLDGKGDRREIDRLNSKLDQKVSENKFMESHVKELQKQIQDLGMKVDNGKILNANQNKLLIEQESEILKLKKQQMEMEIKNQTIAKDMIIAESRAAEYQTEIDKLHVTLESMTYKRGDDLKLLKKLTREVSEELKGYRNIIQKDLARIQKNLPQNLEVHRNLGQKSIVQQQTGGLDDLEGNEELKDYRNIIKRVLEKLPGNSVLEGIRPEREELLDELMSCVRALSDANVAKDELLATIKNREGLEGNVIDYGVGISTEYIAEVKGFVEDSGTLQMEDLERLKGVSNNIYRQVQTLKENLNTDIWSN